MSSIVVCGETIARPTLVASRLRQMLTLDGLSANAPSGGGIDVDGLQPFLHHSSSTIVSMDKPPATLLTDVGLAIVCFVPSYPLSFMRALERWIPLFAHLSRTHLLLLATEVELLVCPSAQAALSLADVEPVDMDDVLCAVSELEVSSSSYAEVGFWAVSEWLPPTQWIGNDTVPNTPPVCFLVVRDICTNFLATVRSSKRGEGNREHDADSNLLPSVEDSAVFWFQLRDQLACDMEERSVLSEWLELRPSIDTMGKHVHPVFVSRQSKTVEHAKPQELLISDIKAEEGGDAFMQRYKRVASNPPETYLVRKATADADRKRAVERSSRRTAVTDVVLQKVEQRSSLAAEVTQLERKRDKLMAMQHDHVQKREWLAETQRHIQSMEELIESESQERATHEATMAALTSREREVLSTVQEFQDIEKALVDLPAAVQTLTESYLSSWNANKSLRSERDAVYKQLEELAASKRLLEEEGEFLDACIQDQCSRIDKHLALMNKYQDAALQGEARTLVSEFALSQGSAMPFTPRMDKTKGRTTTGIRAPPVVVTPVVLKAYIESSHAVLCLAGRLTALLTTVVFPWTAMMDTVIGPLEIGGLECATAFQRSITSPSLSASTGAIQHVESQEGLSRMFIRTSELEMRCNLILEQWFLTLVEKTESAQGAITGKYIELMRSV